MSLSRSPGRVQANNGRRAVVADDASFARLAHASWLVVVILPE
ncbi:MAG: hypothetical protein Q7T28_06535 [Cypionkella sp.]|nr:hypothetical protein [Cypionkella sp.]MDO8326580.1 hypothetical protein [Cypionkella sp.]